MERNLHSHRLKLCTIQKLISVAVIGTTAAGLMVPGLAVAQDAPPILMWRQSFEQLLNPVHWWGRNFRSVTDERGNVWRRHVRLGPIPTHLDQYSDYYSLEKRDRNNKLIWSQDFPFGEYIFPLASSSLGLWAKTRNSVVLIDTNTHSKAHFYSGDSISYGAIDAQGRIVVRGSREGKMFLQCFGASGLAWEIDLASIGTIGGWELKTVVCHPDGSYSIVHDDTEGMLPGCYLQSVSKQGILGARKKIAGLYEVYPFETSNFSVMGPVKADLQPNITIGILWEDPLRGPINSLLQLTPQGEMLINLEMSKTPFNPDYPDQTRTYLIDNAHVDADGCIFLNLIAELSGNGYFRNHRVIRVDKKGKVLWEEDVLQVHDDNTFTDPGSNYGEMYQLYHRYNDQLYILKWDHGGLHWKLPLGNIQLNYVPLHGWIGPRGDIMFQTVRPAETFDKRLHELWSYAQAPEPLPDAPSQPSSGPQPYRTESVLDNDRYVSGGASLATNATKGNVFFRKDGTFLYSPWASTQNTTDTFEYKPVNGTAVGPPTKVTVKIGAVARGTLTALKTSVSEIVGGKPVDGRVEVSLAAPAGGLGVALVSANGAVLRVPDIARVPAGRVRGTFQLSTLPVVSSTSVSFFAERIGTRIWSSLTVKPAQLDSLTSATGTASSGSTFDLVVKLTGKAPAGGIVVGLKSSKALLGVPKSVKVPEGFGSARFKAKVGTVSSPTSARVTATYGSRSRSVEVQLVP